MSNCLHWIPACDGQTDGQTDILPRHSPRYAYASRGKNGQTLNCRTLLKSGAAGAVLSVPIAPPMSGMHPAKIGLYEVIGVWSSRLGCDSFTARLRYAADNEYALLSKVNTIVVVVVVSDYVNETAEWRRRAVIWCLRRCICPTSVVNVFDIDMTSKQAQWAKKNKDVYVGFWKIIIIIVD